MNNPFEIINSRLANIEALLLDIKHKQEQEPTEPTEQFLTIQEAAEFLNLSVPTIYGKVHRRELPVMKQGNRLYFSNMELTEYIKEGRRKISK